MEFSDAFGALPKGLLSARLTYQPHIRLSSPGGIRFWDWLWIILVERRENACAFLGINKHANQVISSARVREILVVSLYSSHLQSNGSISQHLTVTSVASV
jgi:hypothetical protein